VKKQAGLPDSALPGKCIGRCGRQESRKLAGGCGAQRQEIRSTLEKREENMYTGTTIEELINSVERAERHARQEEEQQTHLAVLPWMQERQVAAIN
jgi:shikimate kinase